MDADTSSNFKQIPHTQSATLQPHDNSFWELTKLSVVNSLAPGRYGSNFTSKISKFIIQNRLATFHEIALRWIPQNLTNEKSALVQVVAWCR